MKNGKLDWLFFRFLTLVLETKKMASAASSLSAKERREQAAAARGTTLSNSGSSEKSQLGSMGEFTTLSGKNSLRVSTILLLTDIKVSNFLLHSALCCNPVNYISRLEKYW